MQKGCGELGFLIARTIMVNDASDLDCRPRLFDCWKARSDWPDLQHRKVVKTSGVNVTKSGAKQIPIFDVNKTASSLKMAVDQKVRLLTQP